MKGIPVPTYVAFSGCLAKENGRTYYAQQRRNCTTVCCLANPYTGSATDAQVKARDDFKKASALTKTALDSDSASYKVGFDSQTRYLTLRDYVFALKYKEVISGV